MNAPAGAAPISKGSFRALLLLALLLGASGVAAAVALSAGTLSSLGACLQACASDPTLMAIARGSATLCTAVAASGLLVGALVLAGQLRATRRLIDHVKSRATTPTQRVARLASSLGLGERLTYVVDPAPYAFCYGFLAPRVCVSSGMASGLSQQELRAVLLHESHHMSSRDPLKVLASRLVAGAFFLVPVAADLRDRYLVEKELAADAHVVDKMSPRPLAEALLKIYRSTAPRPIAALATAAVGPFSVMGERIRHLSRPSERLAPLSGRRVAASLAVLALLLLATVGSAYAAERTLAPGKACCASRALCDLSAGGSQVAQR